MPCGIRMSLPSLMAFCIPVILYKPNEDSTILLCAREHLKGCSCMLYQRISTHRLDRISNQTNKVDVHYLTSRQTERANVLSYATASHCHADSASCGTAPAFSIPTIYGKHDSCLRIKLYKANTAANTCFSRIAIRQQRLILVHQLLHLCQRNSKASIGTIESDVFIQGTTRSGKCTVSNPLHDIPWS